MNSPRTASDDPRAKSNARRLLVQALYQRQIGGQTWQDLHRQYSQDPSFARADAAYLRAALEAVCEDEAGLDTELARHSDIAPARLDPVEHAILRLGLWELMARPDIPYRVAINEAVELAKRFGATDGHRYVNAVLDRASRAHRARERGEVA
ncbi:MAG: transcription antitermination factor NusB [Steroidobacteraceae bacterium]|nr:transcription antitermination factor NusB [Steroidobacteraceae bacterium]